MTMDVAPPVRFNSGALPQGKRSASVLFVMLVICVSIVAVIASKSEWALTRLHAQSDQQRPVTMTMDGDIAVYHTGMACVPSREHDPCESVAAFFYVPKGGTTTGGVAILIDEFSGDLSLSVNGQLLAATYNRSKVLRLLPQHPVKVDVPANVLQRGVNRIELRLRSGSILGGFLSRVVVGASGPITASYERSVFWLSTVPTLFGGALALIAAMTGYLGLRHRDRKFILCAIICTSFGISMINDIVPNEIYPSVMVGVRLLRMVAGAYTMAFIFSVSNLPYPVSLRALATFPVAFYSVFTLSTDRYEAGVATIIFWMLLIALMLHGVIILILTQIKSPKRPSPVLLVIGAFGLLSVCVNFAQSLGFSFDFSNVVRGFGPILFVLATGFYLIVDVSNKTAQIERANDVMSEEIRRVTTSLEEIHLSAERHRRSLLIQNERQRLMGDLHDGLAGNLITIQALASDSDAASVGQISSLARRALLDLRLVVESLDSFDGDLAAVLAAFRERIMPQYQQSVARIEWDISAAPIMGNLSPEISLGIFRILQEAIANSVRHGAARNIRVTARPLRGDPNRVLIFVTDDGTPALPVTPGFGMRNMLRRAASIDATVRFRFSRKGSTVLLCLGRNNPVV